MVGPEKFIIIQMIHGYYQSDGVFAENTAAGKLQVGFYAWKSASNQSVGSIAFMPMEFQFWNQQKPSFVASVKSLLSKSYSDRWKTGIWTTFGRYSRLGTGVDTSNWMIRKLMDREHIQTCSGLPSYAAGKKILAAPSEVIQIRLFPEKIGSGICLYWPGNHHFTHSVALPWGDFLFVEMWWISKSWSLKRN